MSTQSTSGVDGQVQASRRAGFTLIELLVVISIIALLISILLPSLGKARDSANTLKCLSNIRQINAGFAAYAAEMKNHAPALYTANPTDPTDYTSNRNLGNNGLWQNVIWPYMYSNSALVVSGGATPLTPHHLMAPTNNAFLCPTTTALGVMNVLTPSNPSRAGQPTSADYGYVKYSNMPGFCYGYNETPSFVQMPGPGGGNRKGYYTPINLSRLYSASATAMLLEAGAQAADSLQYRDYWGLMPHRRLGIDKDGLCNVLYFDGHANGMMFSQFATYSADPKWIDFTSGPPTAMPRFWGGR